MSAAPTSSSPSRADIHGHDGRTSLTPGRTAPGTTSSAPGSHGQRAAAVPGYLTQPPNCSSCDSTPRLGTTRDIWPSVHDGKPMWLCGRFPACDTYVSCHPGSTEPMGLLAGAHLRQMRKRLHQLIDPLWQSEGIPRTVVYQALSNVMGVQDFHMGWADEPTCKLLFDRIPAVRERAMALDDDLHRAATGFHARQPASAGPVESNPGPAWPAAGQHAAGTEGQGAAAATEDIALDLLHALAHDSRGQRRQVIPGADVARLGAIGQSVTSLAADLGWIYAADSQARDWRVTDAGWHALLAI